VVAHVKLTCRQPVVFGGAAAACYNGAIMPISTSANPVRRALLARLYHHAYPLARIWWQIAAPVKIGVRAAVFDSQGRVLLVRHAYGVEGWGFPGGGPNRLEPLEATVTREVWEETGVRCRVVRLLGVYDSFVEGKSDHVAFFVAVADPPAQPRPVSAEILEAAFFALDALPGGASSGTKRRLAEVQVSHASHWGPW
jgi:ADP-ribose pyrophosphatase YjhB (NUDIX family)